MADPAEFIEIADFRAGIWSDIHAGTVVAGVEVMDNTVEGYTPQGSNGAATVEDTNMCRVDKTGALIPLPAAFGSAPSVSGTPDDEYGTAFRPAAHARAWLLDAEVSPIRWYTFGEDLQTAEMSSVYTLWGFHYAPAGDGVANGYYHFILGREYRLNAMWQDIYDFLWMRSDNRVGSGDLLVVPAGSLCNTRFDNQANESLIAADGVQFELNDTMPVVAAVASIRNAVMPDNRQLQAGAIPANEQAFLTDYIPSPGGGAAVKRPSRYTPGMFTGTPAGRFTPASIGISLGSTFGGANIYDVNGAKPDDEWTWHERDRFMQSITFKSVPYAPYMVVAHQGRIVFPDLVGLRDWVVSWEYDPSAVGVREVNFTDDVLWYSRWGQPIGEVIDIGGSDFMTSYTPLEVAEDQVSQIGVVGVVTADELLIVKSVGGGLVVRGDLDNPTIRRLPHIESTGGVICKGAQTPVGYVYGTKTGVFAFDGGDTTNKLSQQIDGFFWNPFVDSDPVVTGPHGRFAYWNGMVHVPNNFIYDIESNSWWRWRVDLGTFNVYLVNNIGQLWAFPYTDTATAGVPRSLFYSFNVDRLSQFWSWKSQPLIETRGRRQSIQDVRLLATPKNGDAATFSVVLIGFNEQGVQVATDTITMTCAANNQPQILREDITPAFVAEYVQVRVFADSNESGYPAPKLHSIRLGIKPRSQTPRHG